MSRVKTFDATGIAPSGVLFAGDLNAIQDQYADLINLTQTLGVAQIQVGASGVILSNFGGNEVQVNSPFRSAGILRGLGGILGGSFTTTQRDAISSPPTGLIIYNTTTARYETNRGTSGTPAWIPMISGLSRVVTLVGAGTSTFTATPGARSLFIHCFGGGGAGGGNAATGAGTVGAGGGGQAGGEAIAFFTGPAGSLGSHSYTIGAGGTGVSGATGNVGGDTIFRDTAAGAICTAKGGNPGAVGTPTPPLIGGLGGAGTPLGAIGDFSAGGEIGGNGLALSTAAGGFLGGAGGGEGAGAPRTGAGAGIAASANTGGGGGGAAQAPSGAAQAGGAGASGRIIVWEFF